MKTIYTTPLNFFLPVKAFRIFFIVLGLLLTSVTLKAQVGIGTISPNGSAQLDITSSDKGLLIPRMDKDGRDGIGSPATGLIIYQTNNTPGFYYYNGTGWKLVGDKPVVGFSATLSSTSVSASTTLAGYSVADPFYSTAGFNAVTGQYTVSETGKYAIYATINYQLSVPASTSLGPGINPYFQVSKTFPALTSLIIGFLPVLNVNMLVLTLKTVLDTGVVTLSGNMMLTARDVIQLGYVASGLTQTLNIGNVASPAVVWSVTKL